MTEVETISSRSIISALINIKIDYTKSSGLSECTISAANGTRYKAWIQTLKVKGNNVNLI